ncbi:MAG: hypothetical protein FJ276_08865, partial [Planctomycetes bacterium]|nr:hypothetical protein [Planctomycetota bacterium]
MNDTIVILMILVPALPLAAAILAAVLGPRILRSRAHWPVVAAFAASFLCSLSLLVHAWRQPPGYERVESLWVWADIEGAYAQRHSPGGADQADSAGVMRHFTLDVTLRIDTLTGVMLATVTFIS